MIGTVVGPYIIEAELGRGGMGIVYRARHRVLRRPAALKFLRPGVVDSPGVLERFLNEARTTSALEHPGIVRVFDCDVLPDGGAFIAMELIGGQTLRSFLDHRGRLSAAEAADIGKQLALILSVAHGHGIVHRDLKPDNIFVLPPNVAGTPFQLKLVDFGIAKLLSDDKPGRTKTGVLIGTPLYMSPEQCTSSRLVDQRTDIYALGCLLFEMVCGAPPYVFPGMGEMLVAHVHAPIPEPRSLAPGLPAALADVIVLMLQKSPYVRPASMHQVTALLQGAVASEGTEAAMRGTAFLSPSAPISSRRAPEEHPLPMIPLPSVVGRVQGDKFQGRQHDTTLQGLTGSKGVSSPGRHSEISWSAAFRSGYGLAGLGVLGATAIGLALYAHTARPIGPSASFARPDADTLPALVADPNPVGRLAASPPSAPALPVSKPPELAPPPSRVGQFEIVIQSRPAGATVCLASTGRTLGRTGKSITVPGWRNVRLLVHHDGFKAAAVTVAPSERGTLSVNLDPIDLDGVEEPSPCR